MARIKLSRNDLMAAVIVLDEVSKYFRCLDETVALRCGETLGRSHLSRRFEAARRILRRHVLGKEEFEEMSA